jgi:CheY-like chemotaxis protein/HPt (histidine-containing phosphotransfer) domain-containing protein
VGIRPEDVKKLFSDYNQVDAKSNRKIGGTGLGLSITKRMVEMMDGSVTVESEYGAGSTFTVRVRQRLITDIPIGAEVAKRLQNFRYSEHKRDRSSKLIRVQMPYARVLVVDDTPTNLDVARGLLKPYGMQVDCVSSGPEAIALIRTQGVTYNAIFMDHMMPIMDGIETTRIIRKEINTEYAKTIPIIALTANAIVGNEDIFLNNGFQAFLSKPIDIIALDTAVNHWVRDKLREKEPSTLGYTHGVPLDSAAPEVKTEKSHPKKINKQTINQWNIPGLDVKRGLDNFEGSVDSYWKILESYVRNTPPLLEKIHPNTKADLPDYGMIVHGIKSSSRTIGAENLGAKAESLEHAAKAGSLDFVSEHHNSFIQEA